MQSDMPLLAALLRYRQENVYPLHTPGHKGGRGMEPLLRAELPGGAAMDVSLMSELDDIHRPEGCLAEAQRLAARLYGSSACLWAVNGTTQAVQAMLLAAVPPGGRVLIPRNAHRSVAGGLILGGLEAVFVQPEYCEDFAIHTQLQPAQVEAALRAYPDIKAVLLTSPNYYGVAAATAEIADICHRHGAALLVDEAHGAHLGFSEHLPPSALQCGADACAQSTHKLTGAMSQCSMLHVQEGRLDLRRAAAVMSLLTTTSPNYLLLASLDAARAQLQSSGRAMAEKALAAAERLRCVCAAHAGLRLLSAGDCGALALDATKVTVNFRGWGVSGAEAGAALRTAGVAVELVDAENVLFLVTYADTGSAYTAALKKVEAALTELERHKRAPRRTKVPPMPPAQAALSPRAAFFAPAASIPLAQSAGRICAEQVSFYPPGIPVLVPGEMISEEILAYCEAMHKAGLPVSGPADAALATIRVICA